MKRYVTEAEYKRMTGISTPTLKHMIATNQVKYIQTEAGYYKIDTADMGDKETAAILSRLDEQQKLLAALCGHLGLGSLV
jgi:hypothetical protein